MAGQKTTVYDSLNKSWKTTTRILFGEELGELKDYEEWLGEYCPKPGKRISAISGKEVTLNTDHYSKTANVISAEESRERAVEPLTINEIKDIDSIVEAIKEKWEYTGNRTLGNSELVEASDLIMDSQNIAKSTNIQQSSNVFSSFLVRLNSKNIFGSGFFGNGEFIVRLFAGLNVRRVFESHIALDCSELYFCHQTMGCSEMLFSFFQRNRRRCIGNLQLPKEKYLELKKKLLSEVAGELRKSKKFPSLFQMVPNKKPAETPVLKIGDEVGSKNMDQIEKAFSATFKIIFKREAKSIKNYEKWLTKHNVRLQEYASPFGDQIHFPEYVELAAFSLVPKKRIVFLREGLELGKRHLNEEELGSVVKIMEKLDEIGYFSAEITEGINENVISSPLVYYAANAYKTYDSVHSKYTGLTTQALDSNYIFGGNRTLNSDFCINCYNSLYLSRCFEVDSSSKCSDALFCHNSEGLNDCMFCFNVKGKRNAIGNLSLEHSKYVTIKETLIGQMVEELEKTKNLELDIFSMGKKSTNLSLLH